MTTRFNSVTNQLTHPENIRLGLSLLNDKDINIYQIVHQGLVLVGIVLFVMALRKSSENDRTRNYFVKSAAALALYTIFFSCLQIFTYIVSGCGWYGCSFSVLFALAFGLFLKTVRDFSVLGRYLAAALFITLITNSLWSVQLSNYAWYAFHYKERYNELDLWLNKKSKWALYKRHSPQEKDNFQLARLAWSNRSKNPALTKLIIEKAPHAVRNYLKAELSYIK